MLRSIVERLRLRRAEIAHPDATPSPSAAPSAAGYMASDGRNLENYFDQVRQMCRPLSNPFCYYETLIEDLAGLAAADLVTVRELAMNQTPERTRICLRHDVDADPITALRMARHLARVGASGSFYLLHTAPYYADFHRPGVVIRNPRLVEWVRGFIVSGSEVGLHCDPLGIVKTWGMDGIEGLRAELAWLRSQGLNVRGTVAHNSGPAYGAENYEVFADLVLWPRTVTTTDGLELPLGRIAMADLGIEYDGTFAAPLDDVSPAAAASFFADLASADIRSESWMRRYLVDNPACLWTLDAQCWLLGKDMWVIAGYLPGMPAFVWNAQLEDVISYLREMPAGSRAMLVVHPEYVSE